MNYETEENIMLYFNRYVEKVYRFSATLTGNAAQAREMTIETLASGMGPETDEITEKQEIAWLLQYAGKLYKKKRKTEEKPDILLLPILEAFRRLRPSQLLPVYLYYQEGMSLMEISSCLQLRPFTVRSRLIMARRKLRMY